VTPGANPATTVLTIQTAGSALVLPPFDGPVPPPGFVILCTLAAALCTGAAWLYSRQKRLRWVPAACLSASLVMAAFTLGCGGGGPSASTSLPPPLAPTGNSTVTVHATAGSVEQTTTIALTIN
jgi:hypothetical protein